MVSTMAIEDAEQFTSREGTAYFRLAIFDRRIGGKLIRIERLDRPFVKLVAVLVFL